MSSRKTRRWVLGGGVVSLGLSVLGVRSAFGVRRLHVQATATREDIDTEFASLLSVLVHRGAVRWEVAASPVYRSRIEALYAAYAETGPLTNPERFTTEHSRLAFGINAYNLLVVVAVLRHWPIGKVGDVRGTIEPRALFGFFYGLRLRLDGRWVHLYGHERGLFAKWPDTRIHAAINCASASCPPLVPRPFVPENLDQQLDAACADWLRGDGVVRKDTTSRSLTLPPLLGLYPGEFGAEASDHGWGQSDFDWVLHWLEPGRASALRALRESGWSLTIPPYDWALSGS